MTIKQLKAALEEAAKKLAADPENADLKSAHAAAKSAYEAALESLADDNEEDDAGTKNKKSSTGGDDEEDEEDDSLDESKLDAKTKAYIQKLRKENGKHRTRAKDERVKNAELVSKFKQMLGGDEEEDAETIAQRLKQQNEELAVSTIILEQAVEHSVGKQDREFFEFFVKKKLASLEEGDELSEEDFADAAKLAKRASRNMGSADGGSENRTSVDGSHNINPDKKNTSVTLEKFKQMGITERSELFTKNRKLYDELFAQAHPKRKAV
jgi:hypothetical protein